MPTSLSGYPMTAPIGPFASESAPQGGSLGQFAMTAGGRQFRYCLVGGTALVAGKLYQAPAEITDHQNMACSTAAIGATSITVTLGATAATANQYAGGYAVVTTGTGAGYTYKISSNPAANASASLVITLDDPIQVATLAADSKIDLFPNPFNGVIVNPTTASSAPVGVAVYAAAAASYSWLQVSGPCAVLSDGGDAVGAEVVASNGTAGAVEDATGTAQAVIGVRLTGAATGEYGLLDLHLV